MVFSEHLQLRWRSGVRRAGTAIPTFGLKVLLAVLLAVAFVPQVARSAGPGSSEEEILAAFRESFVAGYQECNADKVLALYGSEARIATFTRGVLDRDSFALLLRESIGRNSAMDATLEFGAFAFSGDEALVPFRLTLGRAGAGAGANRSVTTDRLYCRLKKQGSWKITMQTYRPDFTLPPAAAPGAHH